MLAIGRYVVKCVGMAKGKTLSLEAARMEMWRKMVISSQKEKAGETLKMFTYEKVQGVTCVELRIAEDNAKNIWLIFTRTGTPLEIFRWFPQIVFTLLTFVRPINVGFSNRFFCLSDKRCLMLIIKKNVEEDKS